MQTPDVVREKQLNIRLSEEEAARLAFLTSHYGINTAALFRMLTKREADALGFKYEATKSRRFPESVSKKGAKK